jgi:hypothetical protein
VAILVTFTIGLVLWIVAWSFGSKPFDGFLITMALLLGATAWHVAGPGLKRLIRGEAANS